MTNNFPLFLIGIIFVTKFFEYNSWKKFMNLSELILRINSLINRVLASSAAVCPNSFFFEASIP